MSGIEVAGLVLGVFPLVIDAAKDLRGVFRDVKTWWHFEGELENFWSNVETEHIKYSQCLQILLEDLEIPEEEKLSLLVDSAASGWHEPHIQVQLRHKIQDRNYLWFMGQLARMNSALEALQKLLSTGNVSFMNGSILEREMFKLRTSFTHRNEEYLGQIRDRNDDIFAFLDRASHLRSSRTPMGTLPRPDKNQTTVFLGIQKEAVALYETFQHHLCCRCTSSHACGIAVSSVSVSKTQAPLAGAGRLRMLFSDPLEERCQTQVNILFLPPPVTVRKTTVILGAAVTSRVEVSSGTAVSPGTAVTPRAADDKLDEVTLLHQQLSKRNRLKAVRTTAPKALFALASSSMSAFGSFTDGKSWGDPTKPQVEPKRPSRIRGSFQKESKKAGKTSPPPPPTVRFADSLSSPTATNPPVGPVSVNECTAAIDNLCQVIKPPVRSMDNVNTPQLGYLQCKSGSRLLLNLDPENQVALQDHPIVPLKTFLKNTPRRDARLKVGCELILATLSLGNSSWIPASWTADDLFLLHDPALYDTPQPYFNHPQLRKSLSGKETRSKITQTRNTLFALGVVLLELIFRDQMEGKPLRLMGEDGKPNAATLATALLWQQKVEEELGYELAIAIKRCLVCMFEQGASEDLGNPSFVKAVWQQVVWPVEEFLLAWNRSG